MAMCMRENGGLGLFVTVVLRVFGEPYPLFGGGVWGFSVSMVGVVAVFWWTIHYNWDNPYIVLWR